MQKQSNEILNYLKTLKKIGAYVGPQRPLGSTVEIFLQSLAKKHGFLRVHLVLFEPETGLLRLRSADRIQEANEATYSPGVGVTGQVFATGQAVIIEKISDDPHFLSLLFSRTTLEMEELAFISVPVLAPIGTNPMDGREVLGTLNVDSPVQDKNALEQQCLFLEVVASYIASLVAQVQDEISRIKRYEVASKVMSSDLLFASSRAMRQVMEQINHFAQGRFPVLLQGEIGVGKEILAKRIHNVSSRKDMPFLICHCSVIPPEKMYAELMGYQKGAFAGAVHSHKGLFEQANGGTVFLESVEKLSSQAQEALLAFLQKQEVTRIGSIEPIALDVRVIVSSTVPLGVLIDNMGFNRELVTRLNLYSLHIPPLRERKEDIIPLAEQMLLQIMEEINQTLSSEDKNDVKTISYPASQLLTKYYWAGNLPELYNCMEQAVKNSKEQTIRAGDLPIALQSIENDLIESDDLAFAEAVEHFEKELIVDALIKANGNILKATNILKSSYRIINYKVKKYNINARQFMVKNV